MDAKDELNKYMGGCNTKKTKSGINRCRRGGNNGSRTQAGQRGRRRTAAQSCLICAFVGLSSLATCARIRRSVATPTCIYYTGARRMVRRYSEGIEKSFQGHAKSCYDLMCFCRCCDRKEEIV